MTMHKPAFPLVPILAMLALAACGSGTTERGLSGAGLGAAVGAGTAALTDADMLGTSLLGAAAGAAAGALTEPESIDLGKPVWE